LAQQIELRISSDPRWLRMVRVIMQEIARQAGFPDGERGEITLAVDEALANVIKHAYRGDPNGTVLLSCEAEEGRLEIELRDRGLAFDPGRLVEKAPDELRVGGRGLFLMRATMDEVHFERNGDTNLVRLRKSVKAPTRE